MRPGRSVQICLSPADTVILGRAKILFGGVTQHFIADADLPVLMAH